MAALRAVGCIHPPLLVPGRIRRVYTAMPV